eukprot:g2978.t1
MESKEHKIKRLSATVQAFSREDRAILRSMAALGEEPEDGPEEHEENTEAKQATERKEPGGTHGAAQSKDGPGKGGDRLEHYIELIEMLDEVNKSKQGLCTLVVYLSFVFLLYFILYLQKNPTEVFEVQDVIKTSIDGLEWSHGNVWTVVDNTGGNPGDSATRNMMTLSGELLKLLSTTSDESRTGADVLKFRNLIYDGATQILLIPRPPAYANTSKARLYELYWTRDGAYLDAVVRMPQVLAETQAVQAKVRDFFNTSSNSLYAQASRDYLKVPKAFRGYENMAAQRDYYADRMVKAYPTHPMMPSCGKILRPEFRSRLTGLVQYGFGIKYWPDAPIYGILTEGTGYVFGPNLLVGGMVLRQKRSPAQQCPTPHDDYPVCTSLSATDTEPFAPAGFKSEADFFRTMVGTGVCESQPADATWLRQDDDEQHTRVIFRDPSRSGMRMMTGYAYFFCMPVLGDYMMKLTSNSSANIGDVIDGLGVYFMPPGAREAFEKTLEEQGLAKTIDSYCGMGLRKFLAEGGVLEVAGQIFYVVNVGLWINICVKNLDYLHGSGRPEELKVLANFDLARLTIGDTTRSLRRLSDVNKWYAITNQISMFINMFRVIGYFGFQPRLAIVTKTLAKCYYELYHFAIVFVVLLVLFSYMAHITLGAQLESFHTVGWSVQTLAMTSMGEWLEFEPIMRASGWIGVIFYWTEAERLSHPQKTATSNQVVLSSEQQHFSSKRNTLS